MRHPAERVVTHTRHYAFLAGPSIKRQKVNSAIWKPSQLHFILFILYSK